MLLRYATNHSEFKIPGFHKYSLFFHKKVKLFKIKLDNASLFKNKKNI